MVEAVQLKGDGKAIQKSGNGREVLPFLLLGKVFQGTAPEAFVCQKHFKCLPQVRSYDIPSVGKENVGLSKC